VVEDYAVVFFGSAVFKISRLLFIAMMCAAPASSTNAAALLPSNLLGGPGLVIVHVFMLNSKST
jgi:hypothetical protein